MPRIYKILLIVSVAFNIAFIGGFIYHQANKPPVPAHIAPAPLRENFKKHKSQVMPFRREYIQCRQQFMEELAKPQVTRKELENKLEETLQKQYEMERQVGISLIEMRMKMSDEKAARYFYDKQPNRQPYKFKTNK